MTAQTRQDARIAELEADNARLRRMLDQHGLPIELRHRVRNILARARLIARRSAESAQDLESYVAHLDDRLDAMARVQGAIMWNIGAGIDLHALISDELMAAQAREGDRALIDGPRVCLQPRAAEALGLALHELAVNAIEHGVLIRPEGRVEVSWMVSETVSDGEATPLLTLTWRETGLAEIEQRPPRRGFGALVLQQMLRYEVDAATEAVLEDTGLVCTIRMPFLPELGRAVELDEPDARVLSREPGV